MTPIEERLKDLKQYLLDEQRSANPSKTYIDDLELSIKQVEEQIKWISLQNIVIIPEI